MPNSVAPQLDMDLDDSFAQALPELHAAFTPDQVPAPTLVVLNTDLAEQLGLDLAALESGAGTALLAGNTVPVNARPTAMAYAGHQFGGYSPLLGDGRAVLLGELTTHSGVKVDLHLKGSGRTPFSRGGDGKATLGPMLREYLIAEAMSALGVPTARALAVVATGEDVRRDQMEPGAIVARVAASHIRVGTFEYAARSEDPELVRRLADYTIERHFPELNTSLGNRYTALFDAVVDAQANTIAQWMLVGFVHGVMNTDNVTISGETIDYGPCAFLDRYDPAAIYSSIDHGGRYAYRNQPGITQWNLARLAETLLSLIDDDHEQAVAVVTEILEDFPARYEQRWLAGMRTKLGLVQEHDGDLDLVGALLDLLEAHQVDYTSAFRALSRSLRGNPQSLVDLFDADSAVEPWLSRWHDRMSSEQRDFALVAGAMDKANPVYIPRNHLVEEAFASAGQGDLAPFHELLGRVTDPFTEHQGMNRFAQPAPAGFDDSFRTFCGT